MRVVFMGTPDFAASILIELKEQHDVVAVYTRADAVRGRGKKLVPSPVKEVALGANIPVFEPRTLRDEAEVERLRALDPDVICVAAYGMILPQAVLDIPKHGCLNVHASLLPKYRGAAPIERAILNGDDEAGVCIMRMEAGLDTGDYWHLPFLPNRGHECRAFDGRTCRQRRVCTAFGPLRCGAWRTALGQAG